MPILLDEHDPDITLTPGTAKSDIVAFLYSNPEYGYKATEIEEHIEIPHETVSTTLKRLYELRYIGKTADGYYHALRRREDLRRYVSSLDQLHRMFSNSIKENHPSSTTPAEEDTSTDGVDEAELEDDFTAVEDKF